MKLLNSHSLFFVSLLALTACGSSPVRSGASGGSTAEIAAVPGEYNAFIKAVDVKDEDAVNREAKLLLEKRPEDGFVLNGLSHYYRKSGRIKMSETLARKVLVKSPNNLRAKMNLALVYVERKEDNKALQLFLEIYGADNNFPDVTENIVNLYLNYARFDQALALLRERLNAGNVDDLLRSEQGRNLSTAYIGVIESNPTSARTEASLLQKLAGQNVDAKISTRAKSLLGKT